MERIEALRDAGAQYFCVDVAHGHAKYVGKMIKRMRQMLPNECIMAGNVATYAGADYLASVHADIVKVGIGPGSICTTRVVAGVGVPQITAVYECAQALEGSIPIIAALRRVSALDRVLAAIDEAAAPVRHRRAKRPERPRAGPRRAKRP